MATGITSSRIGKPKMVDIGRMTTLPSGMRRPPSGILVPTTETPRTGQGTLTLRPRQELAVRRFSQYCTGQWGHLLFHKVGTGKTITSLLIALNSMSKEELENENVKIFIVAPTSAIFNNFSGTFENDLRNSNFYKYKNKLVDFNYPALIDAVNEKSWEYAGDKYQKSLLPGSIIIFDEAHRLLAKSINNSMEAGAAVPKHPLLEDIFFLNKIQHVKKCIVMTGTPIQIDVADICRLLNFVSKSDNFTAENYAPVTITKTAAQWSLNIVINAIRAKGSVVLGYLAEKGVSYGASGLAWISDNLLPQAVQNFGSQTKQFVSDNAQAMQLMTAIAVLSVVAYKGKQYYNNYKTRKAKKRKNFINGFTAQGGSRKLLKGGEGETAPTVAGETAPATIGRPDAFFEYGDFRINPFTGTGFVKQLGLFTTGSVWASGDVIDLPKPTNVGREVGSFASQIAIEQLQPILENLYLNTWDIPSLAQDATQYVSIYDPDIQVKLKGQPYDVNAITSSTELNKIKGIAKNIKEGKKTVKNLVLDSAFINPITDTSALLDMPLRVYHEENIAYAPYQKDWIEKLFSGSVDYEQRAILNLDKYEPRSPDVKANYIQYRSKARMIGNFSTDILEYYVAINEDGTDYDLYKRKTGEKIEDPIRYKTAGGIFKCAKFERCKNMLEEMRTTGMTFNPAKKYVDQSLDLPEEQVVQQEAAFEQDIKNSIGIPKDRTQPTKRPTDEEAKKFIEANKIKADKVVELQPHFKDKKQYLPLVYSYTEDYGLGLFCVYLKSLGYSYILCHTKNKDLGNVVERAKSNGRYPGFDKLTENNKSTNPLCVLIHPTMTEGYDFVYNPAIFVLEPCNSFGDQEQVYGRVLRSYKSTDVATFTEPKRKFICQFAMMLSWWDIFLITKAKLVIEKYKFWKSRLIPTPQQLIQGLIKGAIESPDMFQLKILKEEEKNLKDFERLTAGSVNYADLVASMMCIEPSTVKSCSLTDTPICEMAQKGQTNRLTRFATRIVSNNNNLTNGMNNGTISPASTLTNSSRSISPATSNTNALTVNRVSPQQITKKKKKKSGNLSIENIASSAFAKGKRPTFSLNHGGSKTRKH